MSSAWRVVKFGGSSMGTPETIVRVINRIEAEQCPTSRLAVVVSAMGDTTDWLIEAANAAASGDNDKAGALADRITDLALSNALLALQLIAPSRAGDKVDKTRAEVSSAVRDVLSPLRQLLYGVHLLRECTTQTLDLVMSYGERTSATVLSILLRHKGANASYVDGRDWLVTDDTFGEAVVDFTASRASVRDLVKTLADDGLPVTTGFLGRTCNGRTTTLGRNGSDYTATLLARALDASEVCIWTDVSGVMTADPRIVPDAYPLKRLSYMEAVELAYFGTRMFHPRTMIPLIESGIPMRIRNTMQPSAPGTIIDAMGAQDIDSPTSVTSLEHMALIGVECRKLGQRSALGERILRVLDVAGVPVWMTSQSAHGQSIAVVVPDRLLGDALPLIEAELDHDVARSETNGITVHRNVTLLTLVCETMGQQPNVAGRFFAALGNIGVMIHAIAQGSSSRSISCVIDSVNTVNAVRTVHSVFNFSHEVVSLLILGKGVVGSELLDQIATQQEVLRRQQGIDLRVVAICGSKAQLYCHEGIALDHWRDELEHQTGGSEAPDHRELLPMLAQLPVPILVDCTAASGMESLYEEAFRLGVHVAAANKLPLTIELNMLRSLQKVARRQHRTWNYETTVGASLPVIETLSNLVRTGDTVQQIEGSFSGTLGYLTNEVMDGVTLSAAVRQAKNLGYTEPRPQEDLSGMDVARKALILARELGIDLELSDVNVTPLVPSELLDPTWSLDTFFTALEEYDAQFSDHLSAMRSQGRTLRYLAQITPGANGENARLHVGPVELELGHPATQLRGSEAFVAFTTARYSDYPLIVRGAGAGGAVTAAGVLADILNIAQTARGR